MDAGGGASQRGSCASSAPFRWLNIIFKAVQQAISAVGDVMFSSARSIAEVLRPQPGPARMLVSARPVVPGLVRHAFTCGYGATDFITGFAGSCRARLWHWTTGRQVGHRIGGGDEDRVQDQTMCRFTDLQARPRRFLRQQPCPPGLVSHALHQLQDEPTPAARAAAAAMARALANAAAAEQKELSKMDKDSSDRISTSSESYPIFTYTTSASDMSSDEKTANEGTPNQNETAATEPVPDVASAPPGHGRAPTTGQVCSGAECGANSCRTRACGSPNSGPPDPVNQNTDPCCCPPTDTPGGGGAGAPAPVDAQAAPTTGADTASSAPAPSGQKGS